jgi:hypothetical protein
MLLVAATLLSLSPLVVTFLHVLVGLRWRANSLLGRLDTVLELCIRDKKNLRTRKNLENQLIELHYQVRGFASASKIQEMAEIHRKMPGAPESSVFGVIYGDNGEDGIEKSHKGGRSLKGWRKSSRWNDLRYHLPAAFLCVIYFIGFLMVLVWYSTIATSKKAETAAQAAAMVQTQAASPPDKTHESGTDLPLRRRGHSPSVTGEAAQGTSEGTAQGTPQAITGPNGGAAGGESSQNTAPTTTASALPPAQSAVLAAAQSAGCRQRHNAELQPVGGMLGREVTSVLQQRGAHSSELPDLCVPGQLCL